MAVFQRVRDGGIGSCLDHREGGTQLVGDSGDEFLLLLISLFQRLKRAADEPSSGQEEQQDPAQVYQQIDTACLQKFLLTVGNILKQN